MDDLKPSLAVLICSAADICRKPLIHALVPVDQQFSADQTPISDTDSLNMIIDFQYI